jgi:predicted MPP superfamily phosphohydrolase
VLFSVYFLGNFYIYKRSVQALALDGRYLNYYRTLFLLIVLCYPIAKIGTGFFGPFFLSKQLNIVGSIFMGVMLYCLLLLLLVDIVRLFNYFIHFFPDIITKNKVLAGRVAFSIFFFIIFCIATYGVINAKYLRVFEQKIMLDKLKPEHNGFTIVQISDIHLGDIINEKFVQKVVEKVNSLEPDIVVITGDLIDDGGSDLKQLLPLAHLKSKFGTYFVSGNHDNFFRIRRPAERGSISSPTNNDKAGSPNGERVESHREQDERGAFYVDPTLSDSNSKKEARDSEPVNTNTFLNTPLAAILKEMDIKILHNEYLVIDSAFTLFGLDYRFGRRGNTDSGTIIKQLEGYNKGLPLIMLKHVPNDLDNIVDAGVDLLLCGHTHHGQMFPLTLITDKVYEISHGHGKYKSLQVYVNCGTGFWGPPVKVGVPAEITKIVLFRE